MNRFNYLRNENIRPIECLASTSLLSNESSHPAREARRGFRPTEILGKLWGAGIARDLSSSGRAGDHERNNVENRSNSREARSASGPSLVSLSRGHLLASRSSCLSRLV